MVLCDVPGFRVQGEQHCISDAAYQDFFALWKDAEEDIPILLAAKSEYGRLK